MRRFGQVIGIKPDCIDDYERLHTAVWPDVLATIRACNMRNYSIFRHEQTLFAYFEYVGDDFEADMTRMAADPATKEWWALTEPLQQPVVARPREAWWAPLKEVFHTD